MNKETLKRQFDEQGFVIVRQFLPPDDLQQLRTELDRYIRDVVPGLPGGDAFYQDRGRPETLKQMQHMGQDGFFNDYRRHSRWCELATALIGETCEANEPEWFNKPPGTAHPTPPHQDNFYFCLKPPNVLTMWLALDVVDDGNGCLRYVAGSHQRGIRPHGPTEVLGFSQGILNFNEDDRRREVAIHLQPGDLVVHHGNTIHRAEPNTSPDRNRRAFAMVFRGESCRRDAEAYARYEAALAEQHARMGLVGA
jgi:phytanoyl-CoA hydroxylase